MKKWIEAFPGIIFYAVISFGLIYVVSHPTKIHAQSAASLVEVDYVQGPISGCQTHAGISTVCYGTDGFCFSKVGAAYGLNLAIPAAAGGVTSWNGLTGVVTYAAPLAPVTSVNGKTGAVTIAASTVSTTTLQ